MVHVSPVFLAPYFRHFCPECVSDVLRLRGCAQALTWHPCRFDKNKGTSPRGVCVPAYLSSGIFCAVLSTLFAVAVDMSNPFDMCAPSCTRAPRLRADAARLTRRVGADDLHFELDTEIEEATRALPHPINAVTGTAPRAQATASSLQRR